MLIKVQLDEGEDITRTWRRRRIKEKKDAERMHIYSKWNKKKKVHENKYKKRKRREGTHIANKKKERLCRQNERNRKKVNRNNNKEMKKWERMHRVNRRKVNKNKHSKMRKRLGRQVFCT